MTHRKDRKNKKNHRGGFTLVELIVVLVILAILAALLVPALTGYIDKSKKQQVIAETRSIHTALQTVMSEYYANDDWLSYGKNSGTSSVDISKYYIADKSGNEGQKERYHEIVRLSEVSSLENTGSWGACVAEDGKVSVLVYRNGKGQMGIYFLETQEYIAYEESDFSSIDSYFNSLKNRVYYSPYYQDSKHEALNPMNVKSVILQMMSYKNND